MIKKVERVKRLIWRKWFWPAGWLVAGALLAAVPSARATTRVALMDFSTDDNSYRSIEAAADFTSLVQVALAGEPGVEWVERAQITRARQEFGLAGFHAAGGISPLRRGRMLGADWVVTGHFSSDDQSRATLSVQVIELKYADVIAHETLTLPETAKSWMHRDKSQVAVAVGALQALLGNARTRQQQATNQARVAFLFLADTSERGFRAETETLPREFSDALARAAATNGQIRLIRFPKAYQSTEESELVVDGIIEAGQEAWRRTADLYVWGTYSVTNARVAGRIESRLDLVLNLWDGVSQPTVLKESLRLVARETLPPEQTSALINRLIGQIVTNARPQRSEVDSTVVRQQLAASMVRAYVAMSGQSREQLGLHDRGKFAQAVQMLETACYFDPDNADARVLWITCRYGWWVDFGFDVKNQFWTKWRRSQAWGKYVDRFGLKPGEVPLPFPYLGADAISTTYVHSLEDVVKLFPQWDSLAEAVTEAAEEDRSRRQGVHTSLMEAEYHGFPRHLPPELTMKWKTESRTELAHREQRVAEYSQAAADRLNPPPAIASSRPSGAISNRISLTAQPMSSGATPVQRPVAGVAPMLPAPDWLKNHMAIYGMFRLYPPKALPNDLKPAVEKIHFPPRFEVKVIKQVAHYQDQLWILAMDERSSPTSEATPDLAAERRDKRNRLWCLEAEGVKPNLFEADSLPAGLNSFLFQADQLWLAGDAVGVLDLKTKTLRKYGLAEGLALKEIESLAAAGGRVYAAGGSFKISSFDPASARWGNLPLPPANLSGGTGNPYLLTGNKRWLGYVAGAVLFHDVATGSWTNLTAPKPVRCFATLESAFWIGADNGLYFYDPEKPSLRGWNSPKFIESPMIGLVGNPYLGSHSTVPQNRLEELEGQIRSRLAKMETDRRQAQVARRHQEASPDPFHLNTRIPGGVAALADDGDFLWLGVGNYFGSYLLLLHKPSLSLVASFAMPVRDRIASLAVSDKYVWVGTAYGDNALIRLQKDSFLSVPRNQWTSIAITPEERAHLVRTMSQRDQALCAFYSGDDQRVVELLGGLNPDKASLEEMFMLAWSYDASGVDDPQKSRAWFERISSRHPDSPWAKLALASTRANSAAHETRQMQDLALAKFDRNQDGKLDADEKRAMLRDKDFAKVKSGVTAKEILFNMEQVILRYDRDGDSKLDQTEAAALSRSITALVEARRELPNVQTRSRLVESLLSDRFPTVAGLFARYDTNKDSRLDAAELAVVAAEMQKGK